MARLCFLVVCIFIYSSALLVSAQDCRLPTIAEIEAALGPIIPTSDGNEVFSPNITEGSVQYVCLAQGSMIDTYEGISLIATFTRNPGEAERTRIFDIECNSGTWSGRTGSVEAPANDIIGVPPRTNCYRCRDGFGGNTRCRECNGACNSGLMRCTGSGSGDCCLSFTRNGQCDGSTDCTSSGPNYVATESNNFTCSCNLTCSTGYTINSNCVDCDFTSICDRDSPCMNGGECIQYSPAINYTCDCTGSYTGYNCSDCSLSCSDGYTVNSKCTDCDFTSICDADSPCMNEGECIQYSPSDNYTCDCTGTGYQGVNCTFAHLCTQSGCERCDTTGCCQTCSSGYSTSDDNCSCVCSLSCNSGYTPLANCTSCVLTDICEASNPCGTADCSLGSQPYQYTCYCATNNTQNQSLSASIIAIITVLSLIVAACIELIVILVLVVVVIWIKKEKQQQEQPTNDYAAIVPVISDPETEVNLAYEAVRQS